MKILYAASEAAPFAKSGGLADVAGALPKALVRDGIDARVVMPLYGDLKFKDTLTYVTNFSVPVGWRSQYCGLFKAERNGVVFYFIANQNFRLYIVEIWFLCTPECRVVYFQILFFFFCAILCQCHIRRAWFRNCLTFCI